uniref:Major facilitator superfamily (MFS) profile domain-containing protein n=1 Tax=Oryza punctata TaxID=4537 RepID=A0A0E0LV09_ORYPU
MGREEDADARRRWTLVLVNLASVLEKADEVLLPAVYREVGADLGVSPTALGSLTLCRAIVQAASYPLAAYASARHDRSRVIAVGAFLWAAATLLVAVSGSFLQVSPPHITLLPSLLTDSGTHATFPHLPWHGLN